MCQMSCFLWIYYIFGQVFFFFFIREKEMLRSKIR
jgi:hypothetical protein